MHQSALDHMKNCVKTYMNQNVSYRVLDYGSRIVSEQAVSHRALLTDYDVEYIGVDVMDGPNVDMVMDQQYHIDLPDVSIDVIFCGQVFEHIPFFWACFLDLTRLIKEGGYIFLTAPSRGHTHSHPYDCWRFYEDGYKALAAFANLKLVEVHTDHPGRRSNGRFDYAAIPSNRYWGDTVGVFEKTAAHDEAALAAVRQPLLEWANSNADINQIVGSFGLLPSARSHRPTVIHKAFNIVFPDLPELINDKVRSKLDAGKYEIREANAAIKYITDGERVVELGAGLGFMSTLIKNRLNPASYVAIEGDPSLISYIEETHRLNGVSGVEVHNCIATSDPEMLGRGFVEFQVAGTFWGSSYKNIKKGRDVIRVDTLPLVGFVNISAASVLIADIEGGEIDLFGGIDLPSVNLVIMEMHPSVIGDDGVQRVFADLTRMGLKLQEYIDDRVAVFVR